MRLINAVTGRLESFVGRQIPRYAILSHRWGDEEVTFADLTNRDAEQRIGNFKFQQTIQQTLEDGLEYVWIDTCCIDKQSSAELSLSINSMYDWYGKADRCYVYLHDHDWEDRNHSLSACEWFTRGWTLQELLASEKVSFFDCKWRLIGDKKSLANELSKITRIDLSALGKRDFQTFSIAQRMSWAAKRVTTLIEDQAYCLMGLFNVHMPLLYGEGEGAFLRLQEEIIKDNDDHTIFAWSMEPTEPFSGLLAPSPDRFLKSGDIEECLSRRKRPFSMTNRGLSIHLQLSPWSPDTYLAFLECRALSSFSIAGIFFRRLSEDDQYARVNFNQGGLLFHTEKHRRKDGRPIRERRVFLRKRLDTEQNQVWLQDRTPRFEISRDRLPQGSFVTVPDSLQRFDPSTDSQGYWGYQLAILVPPSRGGLLAIMAGFDFDFSPICMLVFSSSQEKEALVELLAVRDCWQQLPAPDHKRWIEAQNYNFVRCDSTEERIWLLKGHRTRGIKAELLPSENLDQGWRVTLTFDLMESKPVWTLEIDEIDNTYRDFGSRSKR